MGMQDRDWYRQAQREREKERKLEETRAKFSVFSRKHLGRNVTSPTKTGLIPMMVFWCVGVSVGPVSVTNVKVGVGLRLGDENDALLGQSFLSQFDITMTKNQMVLRLR